MSLEDNKLVHLPNGSSKDDSTVVIRHSENKPSGM